MRHWRRESTYVHAQYLHTHLAKQMQIDFHCIQNNCTYILHCLYMQNSVCIVPVIGIKYAHLNCSMWDYFWLKINY